MLPHPDIFLSRSMSQLFFERIDRGKGKEYRLKRGFFHRSVLSLHSTGFLHKILPPLRSSSAASPPLLCM